MTCRNEGVGDRAAVLDSEFFGLVPGLGFRTISLVARRREFRQIPFHQIKRIIKTMTQTLVMTIGGMGTLLPVCAGVDLRITWSCSLEVYLDVVEKFLVFAEGNMRIRILTRYLLA